LSYSSECGGCSPSAGQLRTGMRVASLQLFLLFFLRVTRATCFHSPSFVFTRFSSSNVLGVERDYFKGNAIAVPGYHFVTFEEKTHRLPTSLRRFLHPIRVPLTFREWSDSISRNAPRVPFPPSGSPHTHLIQFSRSPYIQPRPSFFFYFLT